MTNTEKISNPYATATWHKNFTGRGFNAHVIHHPHDVRCVVIDYTSPRGNERALAVDPDDGSYITIEQAGKVIFDSRTAVETRQDEREREAVIAEATPADDQPVA